MHIPSSGSRVGELSEAEVLSWIQQHLPIAAAGTAPLVGIGDDAAVLRFRGDAVVTTDTLVHGPDFRMAWSSAFDIGWKSVAVNVADVAAMGAVPTALVVALTLPAETTLAFIADFYTGIAEACAALAPEANVVGGDLTISPTLTIAITALGDLRGRAPLTRAGAQPGDVIALAGEQGPSGRGLSVLFTRFRDVDGHPVPVDRAMLTSDESRWLDRQLRPVPPISAGPAAADAGATAMMDVSDGLVIDARRLARASNVRLSFSTAALGADARAALVGGEDHSLLATFPADAVVPSAFRVVGQVLPLSANDGGAVLVDGAAFDERGGWDPYQDWDNAAG